MDALPIQEETAAEYASQNPGVMHACGHDGHTAIGLCVARMLARTREELAGTVKFVFQPAEEGWAGAQAMLARWRAGESAAGLRPGVAFVEREAFRLAGCESWSAMAASDRFQITITGRGGHGASPHLTVDPVLAGAQVITALQSIVARNVNPLKSAVVTVTCLTGGRHSM